MELEAPDLELPWKLEKGLPWELFFKLSWKLGHDSIRSSSDWSILFFFFKYLLFWLKWNWGVR